jgi:hypothetical protein
LDPAVSVGDPQPAAETPKSLTHAPVGESTGTAVRYGTVSTVVW